MKTKWLLWSVWVVAVLFVAVQPARCEKIKEIKNLHFSSFGGSTVYSGVIYELTCDDECTVKIKLDGEPYEEAKTYSVSDEQVKELIKLFNKYEVWKWNGFNEHNPNVLDGSSFYFTLNIQDGKKIEARGYMMYPENYGKVVQEMLRILDEGKGEEVEETIPVREINYLYYSSFGSTVNGGVLYKLICDDECTVSIKLAGETNEEAKTYPVSDEQVKELIDLFNKYEVWKWHRFDKCDLNANGDDFVFVLDVQDGKEINAKGYNIYPENYEEVTQKMLRILDESREDNCISEEDNEDNSILEEGIELEEDDELDDEEEGDNGVLVPVIIGAGALVVVLVVIGVARKKKRK